MHEANIYTCTCTVFVHVHAQYLYMCMPIDVETQLSWLSHCVALFGILMYCGLYIQHAELKPADDTCAGQQRLAQWKSGSHYTALFLHCHSTCVHVQYSSHTILSAHVLSLIHI